MRKPLFSTSHQQATCSYFVGSRASLQAAVAQEDWCHHSGSPPSPPLPQLSLLSMMLYGMACLLAWFSSAVPATSSPHLLPTSWLGGAGDPAWHCASTATGLGCHQHPSSYQYKAQHHVGCCGEVNSIPARPRYVDHFRVFFFFPPNSGNVLLYSPLLQHWGDSAHKVLRITTEQLPVLWEQLSTPLSHMLCSTGTASLQMLWSMWMYTDSCHRPVNFYMVISYRFYVFNKHNNYCNASFWNCYTSAHSYEPMFPNDVPPQEQKTMVRSGRQPLLTFNIKACINAVMIAVLLAHSCPLEVFKLLWWLPIRTYLSEK